MTLVDYHIPVLLNESIAGLAIKPDGVYVDLTFGGGGHSREIMKRLRNGQLIAFDQDPDAEINRINAPRFQLIRHNYRYFRNWLKYLGINTVDGILADLGVSSNQFDTAEKGFSFRMDAELDMRMNPGMVTSAADLVNQADESELVRVIQTFGEIRPAHRIVREIVRCREQKPIRTTGDLVEAVKRVMPRNRENKLLAQLFQAFRIVVNEELESLKEMLMQTTRVLVPEGRLVVISYHSLEDRLVKNFLRSGNFEGLVEKDLYGRSHTPFEHLSRGAIVPGETEIKHNPRSRSAKLRIAKRIGES